MTTLSKFLAFGMFAAGAATISFAVPSHEQARRTPIVQPDTAAHGDRRVPKRFCVRLLQPVGAGASRDSLPVRRALTAGHSVSTIEK